MMSPFSDSLMEAIVAELDGRPAWGEVPAMYSIRLSPFRVPVLSRIDVPDEVWDTSKHGMRIADILQTVALRFAANAPLLFGEMHDIQGVAFRSEGWGMLDLEPGTARMSEAASAGMSHTIAAQPDREEIRMMIAVDRDAVTYQAIHSRGGRRLEEISYPSAGGHQRAETTGSFVASLDAIMAAVTGTPMPVRRPGW